MEKKTNKTYKAIGLMSGSSLDGLDIAYCYFSLEGNEVEWELLASETVPFPETWVNRLSNLPEQDALVFAKTNAYFGHYLGETVLEFIEKHDIEPDFIASHGHTIFHDPNKRISIQIGDGAAIAAKTGYPVICDFRSQDVAIDGEGAPLAPAADCYLFPGHDFYMNIGGIANITCNVDGRFVAFDISAANQMLNFLAQQEGFSFDKGGEMAKKGTVIAPLLEELNAFDYFNKAYPKSIGNGWVRKEVLPIFMKHEGSIPDKLRTATAHIAQQTSKAIANICQREKLAAIERNLFITGGGAFNTFLLECIYYDLERNELPVDIFLPDPENIDFKEAILMALLGVLRVENRVNCFSSVTGAQRDTISGAIHQGFKKLLVVRG